MLLGLAYTAQTLNSGRLAWVGAATARGLQKNDLESDYFNAVRSGCQQESPVVDSPYNIACNRVSTNLYTRHL